MNTHAPSIAATWAPAGVTLAIRHLDALGPDGLALMAAELHRLASALDQQARQIAAATEPRNAAESLSAARRRPNSPTPRKT